MAATATKLGDRRDARRNRARIVAAAREVFSSAGADAPAREIARRADVGVATLYRHFPARADLVDAVLEEAFEELIQIAEAALAEPDPWTGFVRFVDEALVLHAQNRALKDVVESEEHGRELARAMRQRIRPLTEQLVARAQAAGALRQDFARAGPRAPLLGERSRDRARRRRRARALAAPARLHARRPADSRSASAGASAAVRGPAPAGRPEAAGA